MATGAAVSHAYTNLHPASGNVGATVRTVSPTPPLTLVTVSAEDAATVSTIGRPLKLKSTETAAPSVVAPPKDETFFMVTRLV